MTRRDRALYLLAYRRLRTAMRREMRAMAAELDGELGELRDELREARRQLERLRLLDAIEADDCERPGAALH
jgi:hypothetical protein